MDVEARVAGQPGPDLGGVRAAQFSQTRCTSRPAGRASSTGWRSSAPILVSRSRISVRSARARRASGGDVLGQVGVAGLGVPQLEGLGHGGLDPARTVLAP
jgi:hypothetical protein